MSCLWMTSDWHLGHKAILKYRQDPKLFQTREELELMLEHRFNSMVTKRDTTYFLGDMAFDQESLEIIRRLKGVKILVLGNHDNLGVGDYLTAFDDVVGPVKKNGFWLSHHPIHPQELYGKPNIHGHTHDQFVMKDKRADLRYFNVSVDVRNFAPVKFQQMQNFYESISEWDIWT